MISRYDPFEAPDPDEWLALDEARRVRWRRTITAAPAFASRTERRTL